ncbi:MAG TPA: hypothetical protein VIF14_16805 [Alphaproteobacteria bacterium]|jgi:hypothetical protein
MEETHPSPPSGRQGWKRWLSGWRAGLVVFVCVVSAAALAFGWWRAGSASLVALALAMIPCGIACALGICVLDRSKTKAHCHSGKATPRP